MTYFMQQIFNALAWGSIVAILGAGYTMTFGVIGLVNFAHGEIMMVGCFALYFITVIYELPLWLGVLGCLIVSIIVGLLIEKIAFKPVRGTGMITLFITSFGVSIIIRNSAVMGLNNMSKNIIIPSFLKGTYLIGDLLIFKKTLIIISIVSVICVVLVYIVKNTKIGIAMRCVSYDSQMAQCLGMNTEKIIITTFAISSVLAGIAALLWGFTFGYVQASMGITAVIVAFIASVIGGVGNVFGAIISGYIIAIGETLFIAFLPPDLIGLKTLFVWIVFFIIIIVKPSGLFRSNI